MFKESGYAQNVFSALLVLAGAFAFLYAFLAHKFLLLFVSAGAIWIRAVMFVYALWRAGEHPIAGQRRAMGGISTIIGLALFISTWYLIVALDPSLR